MTIDNRPPGQSETSPCDNALDDLKARVDGLALASGERAEIDALIRNVRIAGEKEGRRLEVELAEKESALDEVTVARRYTEQALASFQRRFSKLIDDLPVGVGIVKEDGRAIQRNRYLQKMYGYASKEELMNVPVTNHYYDASDRERFLEMVRKVPVQDYEVRLRRVDGTPFWASLSAISMITEAGEKQIMTVIQDIDVRRQTEEALRASEEKFRNFLDNTPIGIGLNTMDGAPVERNKAIVALFGYDSKEEMLQSPTDTRYVNIADRKHFLDLIKQGIALDFECQRQRKDGTVFWVSQTAIPFTGGDGSKYYINVIQDITARKQAEEALKESEERFRRLVENAPVGIGMSTVGGRAILRNRALLEMSGYTNEEMDRIPLPTRYYNPVDRLRFLELADKGIVRDFETRFVRKDGAVYWISMTSIPYDTPQGQHLLINVVQDITKRKRAEDAFRESEEKYHSLFTTMAQGVVFRDSEGRVTEVNPAAGKIMGMPAAEFLGTTLSEKSLKVVHEDGSEFPVELHPSSLALRTGVEIKDVIMRRINPDGSSAWLRVNSQPYFRPGGISPHRVYTTIEDITRFKDMQEELKLRAELLDAATDATFLREYDGNFIYANKAVVKEYGYSLTELRNMRIRDIIAPETILRHEWVMSEINANGLARFETRHRRKDGTEFPVEIHAQSVTLDGKKLIMSIVRNISERKRIEEERRNISVRLLEMQEKERRDIGLELHDQTGQCLTALKLTIGRAAAFPPEKVAPVLADALEMTNEAINQIRNLSLNLRPPMLDDMGLHAALIWHFDRLRVQTDFNVYFSHAGLKREIPREAAMASFRIIQSALTNVMRHAGVKEAWVRVWVRQNTLYVRVKDKGVGFRPAAVVPGKSTGLDGMRERASLLGGELAIKSAPGRGTTVTAAIPLTDWSDGK